MIAEDIRYYLSQRPRQLPSKYLYDALGSALFDAITQLPWYSPTRAERRLLDRHAADILSGAGRPATIVELGPGSGDKLAALLTHGVTHGPTVDVRLIDVSASALSRAARTVEAAPAVAVTVCEAAYEEGLERFARERAGAGRALALFLGSNIGNFDPPACDAFLRTVRGALRQDDTLLLGTDLVKPERDLLLAYDDPLGVTAAFNRNLLVRINRELGADFDVEGFAHRALWNAGERRVEMHLVSLRTQDIAVPGAGLRFTMRAGETIWTESSYKYRPEGVSALLERAGFHPLAQWIDDTDGFALTLAQAR